MTTFDVPVLIVGGGGAVLVRPDRFVAWRSLDASADPTAALGGALAKVLGRALGAQS